MHLLLHYGNIMEKEFWGFCECVRKNVDESQILHLQPKVTSDIIIQVRCNSRVETLCVLGLLLNSSRRESHAFYAQYVRGVLSATMQSSL